MTITNEESIAEIWQLFRETDARFKETNEQFREQFKEIEERFKETDKQFKETDKRFAKTERSIEKMSQKIDQLAGMFSQQWGRLIEALIRPDSVRLFQERGIQVHFVSPRVKRERGSETMELDLMLLNDNELVVIEVKSTLKVDDVTDFLEDLAQFKRFFPEYREYRLFGGVAALEMSGESDKLAYRKGLFVLAISGQNLVEIRNNQQFRPKNFGQV